MIKPEIQNKILAEYSSQLGLYQDLTAISASLLERMLQGAGVQLHSITKRCKHHESLAGKLAKPEKEYLQLSDITDLAAVRITTYFAEDVNYVAETIEREFSIDAKNSIDKRKLLDPDRFGYQSLHYVASFNSDRCRLVEYSRFGEKRFEIQVRSILQHAWAEIEHDLGYKSAAGIPRDIRRRFSRIAGLLELADDEFSAIRRELDAYAATISQEIQKQPSNVSIDKISLQALLLSEQSFVYRLSTVIADIAKAKLAQSTDATIERCISYLSFMGVSTIESLEKLATSCFGEVATFARLWIGESRYPLLDAGIGILYLSYIVLSKEGDKSRVESFVDHFKLGNRENASILVTRILDTYHAANTNV